MLDVNWTLTRHAWDWWQHLFKYNLLSLPSYCLPKQIQPSLTRNLVLHHEKWMLQIEWTWALAELSQASNQRRWWSPMYVKSWRGWLSCCLAQAVFARTVSSHTDAPKNQKQGQHIASATIMVLHLHSCFSSLWGIQPPSQWLLAPIAVLCPDTWDNKPSRSIIFYRWLKWYYSPEIHMCFQLWPQMEALVFFCQMQWSPKGQHQLMKTTSCLLCTMEQGMFYPKLEQINPSQGIMVPEQSSWQWQQQTGEVSGNILSLFFYHGCYWILTLWILNGVENTTLLQLNICMQNKCLLRVNAITNNWSIHSMCYKSSTWCSSKRYILTRTKLSLYYSTSHYIYVLH